MSKIDRCNYCNRPSDLCDCSFSIRDLDDLLCQDTSEEIYALEKQYDRVYVPTISSDGRKLRGVGRPKYAMGSKIKTLSLRVEAGLYNEFKESCRSRGLSVSASLRRLMREVILRNKKFPVVFYCRYCKAILNHPKEQCVICGNKNKG